MPVLSSGTRLSTRLNLGSMVRMRFVRRNSNNIRFPPLKPVLYKSRFRSVGSVPAQRLWSSSGRFPRVSRAVASASARRIVRGRFVRRFPVRRASLFLPYVKPRVGRFVR